MRFREYLQEKQVKDTGSKVEIKMNGKKQIDRIYTYDNDEEAKRESRNIELTRYEDEKNNKWKYYFRGKEVKVEILKHL